MWEHERWIQPKVLGTYTDEGFGNVRAGSPITVQKKEHVELVLSSHNPYICSFDAAFFRASTKPHGLAMSPSQHKSKEIQQHETRPSHR
jgi:hypothetical protein